MLKLTAIGTVLIIGLGYYYLHSKELIIVPMIHGTLVTDDGKPVTGQTIERSWEWSWTGKTGSDRTTTDQDGQFSFPVVIGRSVSAQLLPHQPDIRTVLQTEHEQGSVSLFSMSKGEYKHTTLNRTLATQISNTEQLLCGISSRPGPIEHQAYAGQCVWRHH